MASNMMLLYSFTSFSLSIGVVLYAYATRIRFYPMIVFLFSSKFAAVSLLNSGLVLGFLFSLGCIRLFLGKLRDQETDAIWEHLQFSITETAFALTTFRDELNMRVALLFCILLFAKVFHILFESRVELVEQQSNTNMNKWIHVRLFSLAFFMTVVNSLVMLGCGYHVSQFGPSVYVLFAFEHSILLVSLFSGVIKYCICLYDMLYVEGRWANKSMLEMYVALTNNALQFVLYLAFAFLILNYYGVPIHLMRSLYVSFRNLIERISHFIRFKRILKTLNERFPDATPEELASTDRICIICREEMDVLEENNRGLGKPKKLQCNHLFHSFCLQTWLERQFSCPTCRRSIPTHHHHHQQQQQQQQPMPAAEQPVQFEEAHPAPMQQENNVEVFDDNEEEGDEEEIFLHKEFRRGEEEEERQKRRDRFAQAAFQRLMKEEDKNHMGEEFVAESPPLKASLLKRRMQDQRDDVLREDFSKLFPPLSASSPQQNSLSNSNDVRELLELEVKVFQAQAQAAEKILELTQRFSH